MTLDQVNELINRGYIGAGLLAIAVLLLLIYDRMDSSKESSKKRS